MLVIDFHSLSTVNALDFVEQILLNFFRAADPQNVFRNKRTSDESVTRGNKVAGVNQQLLAVRNDVLELRSVFPANNNNSLADDRLSQVD